MKNIFEIFPECSQSWFLRYEIICCKLLKTVVRQRGNCDFFSKYALFDVIIKKQKNSLHLGDESSMLCKYNNFK